MPQINILPKEIYQLIAAGEVVERPSSIVKEMIENSIDANAKHITIEIKNGGSTYIRITDDGCGIEKDEVQKVFISHATSKIKNTTDLDAIGTLGFRGEAMASISAVAKVELLTRATSCDIGTRYEIVGGKVVDNSSAGCPQGTTIVVRDIFFNVPARMKFLKKDVTEGNSVANVVESVSLSHPEIAFRFIRDGKQTLVTSGNNDLKSTVYSVLGKEFSQSLIEVNYTYENMKITGLVTKPTSSRKSRAMQYFFINNRFVKSKTAMAALEQAYRNSIMVGKFPGCVLNIQCDNSFVDVNVHPAKTEVRFANEKPVFQLVYYGVKSAIEVGDTVKQAQFFDNNQTSKNTFSGKLDTLVSPQKSQQIQFKQQNPDNFWRVESSPKEYKKEIETEYEKPNNNQVIIDDTKDIQPQNKIDVIYSNIQSNNLSDVENTQDHYYNKPTNTNNNQPKNNANIGIAVDDEYINESNNTEQSVDIPQFKVIGQAFKTYIIVEIEKDLYFIDKHAAHERMNFEKLKANTDINSQVLLTPVTVKLSQKEYTVVCNNIQLYSDCGFKIEDFGNTTIIVRECPSMLNGEDVKGLIEETAQKLLDNKTDIMPDKMDWIFHSTSCRSAVKAGDTTTPQEAELFVAKLLSMPNIRYCPHGRPVLIKMSKYDIEKQFGRA